MVSEDADFKNDLKNEKFKMADAEWLTIFQKIAPNERKKLLLRF